MAYEMVMPYHLHMPSYFLETFTEYPSGNLDKMKIRVGKAKYKDDVTPAAIHKVDSTRMDLGRRIVERFHRIVGVR